VKHQRKGISFEPDTKKDGSRIDSEPGRSIKPKRTQSVRLNVSPGTLSLSLIIVYPPSEVGPELIPSPR
jgi:hypothetical protein